MTKGNLDTQSKREGVYPSAASCSRISRSSLARSASRILMSVSDSKSNPGTEVGVGTDKGVRLCQISAR